MPYNYGYNLFSNYNPKGLPATPMSTSITPAVTKIFDEENLSNVGVLYWHQETLEQIAELSGPLAAHNEFQIHYWALVARITCPDKSIIDLAFPTAIFNYAQEVTSAHIDFELKDVETMSNALKPVHNVVVNKLKPLLEKSLQFSENYSVEFIEVPLNTMHRHPTGVASFSGTDLRKNHTYNTGIVFPLDKGTEVPSFSSIIYNNPVRMIHTEYRIANGDVASDAGITYSKGRCLTYIKGATTEPSDAARLFGAESVDHTYTVNPTRLELNTFIDILYNLQYEVNTQFIKAANLTKATYTPIKTQVGKSTDAKDIPLPQELTLVYDKAIVERVKNELKLTILDFPVLDKMSRTSLIDHCIPLENFYYSSTDITKDSYAEVDDVNLLEFVMEIQDNIIEELIEGYLVDDDDIPWNIASELENPSYKEKVELLEACGAPKADLKAASPETIDKWYNEILNPY